MSRLVREWEIGPDDRAVGGFIAREFNCLAGIFPHLDSVKLDFPDTGFMSNEAPDEDRPLSFRGLSNLRQSQYFIF